MGFRPQGRSSVQVHKDQSPHRALASGHHRHPPGLLQGLFPLPIVSPELPELLTVRSLSYRTALLLELCTAVFFLFFLTLLIN